MYKHQRKSRRSSRLERICGQSGVIYIQFIGTILFILTFGFYGLEFASYNRHRGYGDQIAREIGLIVARLCADEVAYERSLTENLDPRIVLPGSPFWVNNADSPQVVSCLDQARRLVLNNTRGRGEFTNEIDAAVNLFVPRSLGSTEFTRCFHYPDGTGNQLVGKADTECDHTNANHLILSSREWGRVTNDEGNEPHTYFISKEDSRELESVTAEWVGSNLGSVTNESGTTFTAPFVVVVEVSIRRPGLLDLDPTNTLNSTIYSRIVL